MRRFASVFASRRDRPDAPSNVSSTNSSQPQAPKKPCGFPSLARRATQPSLPPLIPNSSSSSSSGSTLRTPDDALPRRPSKKGSWKSWLGAKKHDDLTGDEIRHHHLASHPPSNMALSPPRIDPCNVETDDTDSSPSEEGSEHSENMLPCAHSPSQIARARANARIMIMNSLIQQFTSPPLLDAAEFAPFPRSCSPYQRLPRRDTLESKLHKRALLSRLDRLSPSEESLVAKWLSKTVVTTQKTTRDPLNDFFPDASALRQRSKGLRSWISRPYYEERVDVWTWEESGNVVCSPVAGPRFGVAALEYSEVLDVLAGTLPGPANEVFEGTTFDPTSELLPSSQDLDPPVIKVQSLETTSLSLESPITMVTSEPSSSSSLPNSETTYSPSKTPVIGVSASKRGVRFAEDDSKDDQIPLGYLLRKRKNKEQKAKFLRQERERRAVSQLELTTQEEERARREAESLEMEKLRRARELERKRMEEQEKRGYMGEVQAARVRREAARAGQAPSSSALLIHPHERDRSEIRDSGGASPRNSSSRGSVLIVPMMNMSSYDGSPASSLPATPGSQISFSRPPSVYSAHTASSEDVRSREARRISRRSSVVSDPSKQMPLQVPYDPRALFMPFGPSWGSIPPVPPIPPIPLMPATPFVNAIPLYGVEMPLLPPAAPFMMDQYRSRSTRSYNPGSQESLRQYSNSMPRNHSSDGVTSKSSSSTHGPHHRRRSSDGPVAIASTSGRAVLDRGALSQYELRSSPMHPETSQTSPRRHSAFVDSSLNSTRRTSVAQPHPSPSRRNALVHNHA
ncbi:hypothetical protein V8B97DRAFT_71996 [Scleroderma yunnanense]